jgi:hypothetical protein
MVDFGISVRTTFVSGNYLAVRPKIAVVSSERFSPARLGALGKNLSEPHF